MGFKTQKPRTYEGFGAFGNFVEDVMITDATFPDPEPYEGGGGGVVGGW
ncbi:MAG: hypothetical protein KTR14_02260 [Vampirovibrio sp.]|nr:hypothetical protein [Vampirovibrio sp.]